MWIPMELMERNESLQKAINIINVSDLIDINIE